LGPTGLLTPLVVFTLLSDNLAGNAPLSDNLAVDVTVGVGRFDALFGSLGVRRRLGGCIGVSFVMVGCVVALGLIDICWTNGVCLVSLLLSETMMAGLNERAER